MNIKMKINLFSLYNNFTDGQKPEYIEWVKQGGVLNCYSDCFVTEDIINKDRNKSVALLIEPRSIQPRIYEYMQDHGNKFRYVFTHDDILLKELDNAFPIVFGGVYGFYPKPKTKEISIISSNKEMCELHKKRLELCRYFSSISEFRGKVDCLGTFDGGKWVNTEEAYGPYKFSIVIENCIDDYWFTEKICNAFASKTVPIYYGARKISNYFNSAGIIQVQDIEDIPDIVRLLDTNKFYTEREYAICENCELVKRYVCFEDWFYLTYKKLLLEVSGERY